VTNLVFVNNSRESFGPTASGAIATCVWEVCRVARSEGTEPMVITQRQTAEPYPWSAIEFVDPGTDGTDVLGRINRRVTGWSRISQRRFARAALDAIRQLQPSAVICNNDPQVAVYLAERLPRTVVTHWFHNVEMAPDRWRRAFSRSSVRPFAVSRYVARAIEALYVLAPGRVAVGLNGVDASRFTPAPQRNAEPAVVGFLGRLAIEKGADTLLEACIALSSRRQDFRIDLIGDTNWGRSIKGSYRDKVDHLCEQLRVANIEVVRHGHVARSDVPAIARSFTVQVLPSRWDEPCALTLFEGMALGLPIVATATGGTPEVVGSAAMLVPREDPQAMADAIEQLLNDAVLRERLGSQARQRAETLRWSETWRSLQSACA